MAERSITAKSVLLYIDPAGGTDYSNVVCLTSHDFSLSNTTNSTTTYCGTSSSPGDRTTQINLSGQTLLDPLSGKVSAPDLFDLANNQTTFSWKISPAIPAAGDMVKTGNGYFSAYAEQYSATAEGAFSGTIAIDGDVTQVISSGS